MIEGTAFEVPHTIGTGQHGTGTVDPASYGRGFIGSLYDRSRSVKDDAAMLRRILRQATREATPLEGWEVSVRYRTASMMRAIDVRITAPAGQHVRHDFPSTVDDDPNVTCGTCGITRYAHSQELEAVGAPYAHGYRWAETPAAYLARTYADRVHAAFNEDDSDTMTDYFSVKFYGHVTVTS